VYQLIDTQVVDGQTALNVYFYRLDIVSAGNVAQELVTSWIAGVLPSVVAIQTGNVSHISVGAKNLFNESEAYTELVSEAGTSGGEMMNTFSAVGFRLIGDNAAVRDGQKRFVGVDESSAVNGVITGAGYLAAVDTLAGDLVADLSIGLEDNALTPVIVKRILDGLVYRLPATPEEAIVSVLLDALYNVYITSQTSRKVGVGE